MISRLLLLGATGDLAGRFLLPALAWLEAAGELPADLQVVGAAAPELDDDAFRASVAARLDATAGDLPADAREAALRRLRYRRFDAGEPATVAAAVRAFDGAGPVAAYLALPRPSSRRPCGRWAPQPCRRAAGSRWRSRSAPTWTAPWRSTPCWPRSAAATRRR